MTQTVENTLSQNMTSQDALLMSMNIPRINKNKIDYTQAEYVTLDKAVLQENRILTGFESNAFSESYHLLRTQILRRLKENNWNTLAVTSPGKGEGKTLTAINLAISMAREIDKSVLLVDANLRNPTLLDHFGLTESWGLSDYLTDDIPIEDMLIQSSDYEDLVILPAGKPIENSAEMLNSSKMEQLIKTIKACHDNWIIIFDLPPVLLTTEALAFSSLVESSLLVIEDGATKKSHIESAIERLSSTNIIGTVMNKAA
jgi:capsular exopolysaccharide synthesis family protein